MHHTVTLLSLTAIRYYITVCNDTSVDRLARPFPFLCQFRLARIAQLYDYPRSFPATYTPFRPVKLFLLNHVRHDSIYRLRRKTTVHQGRNSSRTLQDIPQGLGDSFEAETVLF